MSGEGFTSQPAGAVAVPSGVESDGDRRPAMALQTPPRPPGGERAPQEPGDPQRSRIQVVALVLALLLIVGVTLVVARLATDGEGEARTEAPRPTAAPATSISVSHEQAVLDAYNRSKAAVIEAANRADPRTPSLLASFSDDALREWTAFLNGLRANGLVGRGTIDIQDARVVSIGGNSATVRARGCDRSFKYDAKTGELKDSPDVTRFEEEATLVAQPGGAWKVTRVVGEKTGTCAA